MTKETDRELLAQPMRMQLFTPPQVGWWIVGGCTRFAVVNRPTDEQIKNTEALLGWKWEDVKP